MSAQKDFDDSIFDDYGFHYEQLTYQYFGNFIKQTDRTSRIAFLVANMLDADSLGLTELSKTFPVKKRRHQERVREFNSKISPLQRKQKQIMAQINTLELEVNKFSKGRNDPEAFSLNRSISELNAEYRELGIHIDRHKKPAAYRVHYAARTSKATGVTTYPTIFEPDWNYINDWITKEKAGFTYKQNPIFKNLKTICDYFKIPELESQYLRLLVLYQLHSGFKTVVDKLSFDRPQGYQATLAKMLGTDAPTLRGLTEDNAPLMATRLVMVPSSDDKERKLPYINPFLMQILSAKEMTLEQFASSILGKPISPESIEHQWDVAFDHIDVLDRHIIEGLFGNAKGQKKKGINVIFYGMQDTGKTTAGMALAKYLGMEVYLIGEKSFKADKETKEISADERLGRVVLAQILLRNQPKALLIVDECEHVMPKTSLMDMFMGGGEIEDKGGRKLFINRLLEDNETPTLWIANEADSFIAPVKRRFKYSYEFGIPPANKRRDIWLERAKAVGVELSESDALALARKYRGPAGMAVVALEDAKLANLGVTSEQAPQFTNRQIIERAIEQYSRIVLRNPRAFLNEHAAPDKFDPQLMNVSVEDQAYDLIGLTQAIKGKPHRNFSVLAWGPPGGGKDAYACWLAEELGMEVMYRRASDLMDPYHGVTEKKMRKMFEQAKDTKSFLHLAEADHFFMDRRRLEYTWMISMVEEMLTNLESHPMPCLFSTNLVENFDPASKRRMTFKLKFDYLRPEQARRAFELYFDESAPRNLDHLSMLSSGDFANVARQLRFFDPRHPEDIVDMLHAEMRAKLDSNGSDYKDTKAGFTRGLPAPSLKLLPKIDDSMG